jgi:UPF0042 nucleotide-binding protein
MQPSPLVIITGPSGSGKGTLLRALEDRGYFCVDNLPIGFLTKFAELLAEGAVERAALVVDAREGPALDGFLQIYGELKKLPELRMSLWYVDASDEVLIRRFSETRRPHPIDPTLPVRQAIGLERQRLDPIRAMADQIVETSHFSIHELRTRAQQLLEDKGDTKLLVTFLSFGYKYGIPVDADMVFDVRFLPNPHFVPNLRALTGADPPVIEFMETQPLTSAFLERLRSMLEFLLPEFEREGKAYLTIAVGCTGGRHRSVMIVNALSNLADPDRHVKVVHRDIEK